MTRLWHRTRRVLALPGQSKKSFDFCGSKGLLSRGVALMMFRIALLHPRLYAADRDREFFAARSTILMPNDEQCSIEHLHQISNAVR